MEDIIKYIRDNLAEVLSKVTIFLMSVLVSTKIVIIFWFYVEVKCEWNFLATSHRKSPFDGIVGIKEQLATKAIPQRPLSNQILTADKMFEFRVDEIKRIDFLFLKNQEIGRKDRYQRTDTIPEITSFHHFIPIWFNYRFKVGFTWSVLFRSVWLQYCWYTWARGYTFPFSVCCMFVR